MIQRHRLNLQLRETGNDFFLTANTFVQTEIERQVRLNEIADLVHERIMNL